jgi:hypothetical protein
LQSISFLEKPEAHFIPPHELKPEETRLDGYQWLIAEQPTRAEVTGPRLPKKPVVKKAASKPTRKEKRKAKAAAKKAKKSEKSSVKPKTTPAPVKKPATKPVNQPEAKR